ncbi:2-dehydro-3-deoxygluconokinase, partial [Salmonella enterica subsp. enterica serovar Heidelberg str. N18413]
MSPGNRVSCWKQATVTLPISLTSATLNTSVYIARQVDSAALAVHYVTALGTDSFSQQMLEAWQHENVDTSLTQRMENRLPGLYYIETDDTGERT